MNSSSVLAVLGAAILLAACSHRQPDPVPDPVPTGSYSSKFTNFDPIAPDRTATYAMPQVSANAATTATTLKVHLGVASEDIYLEVPLATLGAQWVGTYSLRCPQRPTDPVAVTYLYYPTARSSVTYEFAPLYMPRPLAGSLTITAYDASRHLLSGRFVVSAWQLLDPLRFAVYLSDFTLAGEFALVKTNP